MCGLCTFKLEFTAAWTQEAALQSTTQHVRHKRKHAHYAADKDVDLADSHDALAAACAPDAPSCMALPSRVIPADMVGQPRMTLTCMLRFQSSQALQSLHDVPATLMHEHACGRVARAPGAMQPMQPDNGCVFMQMQAPQQLQPLPGGALTCRAGVLRDIVNSPKTTLSAMECSLLLSPKGTDAKVSLHASVMSLHLCTRTPWMSAQHAGQWPPPAWRCPVSSRLFDAYRFCMGTS